MKLRSNIYIKAVYYCIGLILLVISNNAFATVVIAPNTIINSPVVYSGDTLDMSNGSFIVNAGGNLTIDNCTINGTISATNPWLITLQGGDLNLTKNTIVVTSSGITQSPKQITAYRVIRVRQANAVNITGNIATVDTFYTVGFLMTNPIIPTDSFIIKNNMIKNFHTGLYLLNSNNAQITDNIFQTVSFGNIFNLGNMNSILRNQFLLPGNFSDGDTIDVLSSNDITIRDNLMESGTCVGVAVVSSHNVLIETNKISDGRTYAVKLGSKFHPIDDMNTFLFKMMAQFNIKSEINTNITIRNNLLTQNRYAIAGNDTDFLSIENNYIVQKFPNAESRKVWTDNSTLLKVTNLTWVNNLYKEAFTQVNGPDDSQTLLAVPYPAAGGVVLP